MSRGAPLPAGEPPEGAHVGEWSLRADPESAGLARRLVAQALEDASDDARRKAVLVTSELIGNAVRYARGGVVLAVQQLPGGWLLSVSDGSPSPPSLSADVQLSETGRGLLIVSQISEEVGWARTAQGKVVWARLDGGEV